jgi:hypothetical protein
MAADVLAAAAGALTAAFGQINRGRRAVAQTALTGYLTAYYLADNLILIALHVLDVTLLASAAYFLCALFGSVIYERVKQMIRAYNR